MKNILVYAAFFLRALGVLIISPYLTRIIDKDTWGIVISAQGLTAWITLLIEFGFGLSAAGLLALVRDNKFKSKEIFEDVMSAKVILSILAIIITFALSYVGILSNYKEFVYMALILGLVQGFMPIFYFQATEKLYIYSIIDLIFRLIYFGLVFTFVKFTEEAYLVLLLLITTSTLSLFTMLFFIKKDLGLWKIYLFRGFSRIKGSKDLAIFTLITSVYSTASVYIFGIFANPVNVATYGNSDRLIRAGISVMGPLNQIILPKSQIAFSKSHKEGLNLVKRLIFLYIFGGILICLSIYYLAPIVIGFLYGSNYEDSIVYLRCLALLIPLTAINTVFTYHYFIPMGMSKFINSLYVSVSLASLASIVLLVPSFGGNGMVISMILPEILALVLLYVKFIHTVNRDSDV